jgi:hypothetical protein
VHAARARRPEKVIADVRADLSDAAALAVTDDPDMLLAMPESFRADLAQGWNRPVRPARRRSTRRTVHKSSSHKSTAKPAAKKKSTSKATVKKSTTASGKSSKTTSKATKTTKTTKATAKKS